jgi:putative hemolysin
VRLFAPKSSSEPDEISYASPGDPWLRRIVIRAIERASGQGELKRMYLERKSHPISGESFWDAAVRKLRLQIRFNRDAIAEIPAKGPLVLVANHPFGVIDGLVLCWLVSHIRSDFKVLAHSLLTRAEEPRPYLLPIDFEETAAAIRTNVQTRKKAIDLVSRGGALIVFPSGMVSTTPSLVSCRAKDPDWKTFTARIIFQAKADVVPAFFHGQNTLLFQIVSHMSMTLRLSLLLKEAHDRIGSTIEFQIGKRLSFEELATMSDRRKLMSFLRDSAYALADRREALRPAAEN